MADGPVRLPGGGLKQPGPVAPERIVAVPATVTSHALTLEPGRTLLVAIHEAASRLGVRGATVTLEGGAFAALPYVIPASSPDADHVAYFSAERTAPAGSRLTDAACTYGFEGPAPIVHCHAVWTEPDGTVRGGHIVTERAVIGEPIVARLFAVGGAGFERAPDPETNFTLLGPVACPDGSGAGRAVVLRVRPNEEIGDAVERACREAGVRHGRLCGGVGSLVSPRFADGRQVASIATEVFVTTGEIAPDVDGVPRARIAVALADMEGAVHRGLLARGRNPVCITFELVIEEAGA